MKNSEFYKLAELCANYASYSNYDPTMIRLNLKLGGMRYKNLNGYLSLTDISKKYGFNRNLLDDLSFQQYHDIKVLFLLLLDQLENNNELL